MLQSSKCKFQKDGPCHVALACGAVPGVNITRFDLCDLCSSMQSYVNATPFALQFVRNIVITRASKFGACTKIGEYL